AATCFPTRTRSAPGRIRSGSIPCASTAASCGARKATRPRRCRSMPGSPTWFRPDEAYTFAMAHDHHHDHDHEHGSELSDMQLRTRALETILIEKGYIDPAA